MPVIADPTLLSVREQAAQLLMPRIGSNMQPPRSVPEDQERVAALLDRCPVGGLLLFNGTVVRTPDVLNQLQSASKIPLLVASDIERGVGQQMLGATVFPHAMAFGAIADGAVEAVGEAARVIAREARACGIHVTLGPVADVHRNPRNPIIATRSFGSNPEHVARLVRVYIRVCRQEGLLTVAKHFPGHGGTTADSHAELPVVNDVLNMLERNDLPPFRAAVESGVDGIMTAHVAYPALDPAGRAATVSPAILQGLLRGKLGFQGPVLSDSLLMAPIRETFQDAGEQAVALVNAGVDLLLDPPEPEAAVDALVSAVMKESLPAARLEEACARVLGLKQRLVNLRGDKAFLPAPVEERQLVGSDVHRRIADEVAEQAITLLGEKEEWTPATLLDERSIVVLLHTYHHKPAPEPLGRLIQDAILGISYVEVGPEAGEAMLQRIAERAEVASRVVVVVLVKPAAWQSFGLASSQTRLLKRLCEHESVQFASLGSPDVLAPFSKRSQLCTYSDVHASQHALAKKLLGAASDPHS